MYLIGIDIGTTSTKIILIDLDGHVVASVEHGSTLLSQYAGWAEEDANQWWENVCKGVPECIQQAGIDPSQVEAVGTSGMVPAVVLLNKEGDDYKMHDPYFGPNLSFNSRYTKSSVDEMVIYSR